MKKIIYYLAIFSLAGTAWAACPADMPDVTFAVTGDNDTVPLKWNIYLPSGVQFPRPAVLVIHIGGFRSGSREQSPCTARDLADAGFIALLVDYRLDQTDFYLAAQTQAAFAPAFAPFAQVLDIKKAIQKARRPDPGTPLDGLVNGFVGAVGGSAGGAHALWCAATDTGSDVSDKLDAAVLLSGPYDFANPASLTKYGADSAHYKDCIFRYIQTNEEDPQFQQKLREASPINQVNADVAPLFVCASEFDPITPPHYEILTNKIRQLGRTGDCKKMLLTGDNATKHAFELWNAVKADALRFLDQHLR
jgi:acetyl esterase/lipase